MVLNPFFWWMVGEILIRLRELKGIFSKANYRLRLKKGGMSMKSVKVMVELHNFSSWTVENFIPVEKR